MADTPRGPRLLALISRDRTLLHLALEWLLVIAPGLAVVAIAGELFRLTASSSQEPLLCCSPASLRVVGGAKAILATHAHDGGQ